MSIYARILNRYQKIVRVIAIGRYAFVIDKKKVIVITGYKLYYSLENSVTKGFFVIF